MGGSTIWLSQPAKTLDVPSLVPDFREASFTRPASYLLILAGTGIVAASQVLHHTDQLTCFGATPILTSPISLIYACRKDDVCMLATLIDWCKRKKLQQLTLAISESREGEALPYEEVDDADLTEIASLATATMQHSRLSQELLEHELASLTNPCRVVVSGPSGFNSAVRDMLTDIGVSVDAVTILSA